MIRFQGVADKAARFLQKEQLCDAVTWARFVDLYRSQPDGENQGWRGEYWGKMMRGAVLVYEYTRDPELYEILTESVRDMMTVAEADGRVSTYERANEFRGWDLWCRKYVLLGMLYFYDICRSAQIKEKIIAFSVRHADYIIDRIGDGKMDITKASSSWFGINSSSLLEPMVWLYKESGEKRFLDFAAYIVNRGGADRVNVFECAYENKLLPYQYGVSKAYELTSCFEGLIAYYEVTGIEKYKTAAINFGYAMLDSEVSIIGSLGCTHELLDHTLTRQTAQRGEREQETCVTVTWMKYCASLYRLTADKRFADAIEVSFYNAYLGALNTEHRESGWMEYKFRKDPEMLKKLKSSFMPFDSYSPLTPGVRGIGVGGNQVLSDGTYYGCCACIGAVGLGIYSAHRLLRSPDGLVLSFLDDGESVVKMNGEVKVRVSGNYPKAGRVNITVTAEKKEKFDLKVRIPDWSEKCVTVSGKDCDFKDGYAVFSGEWDGECELKIDFDMALRTIRPINWDEDVVYTDMTGSAGGWHFANAITVKHKPEYDDYIALFRGPITLAADSRLGKAANSIFTFSADDGKIKYKNEERDGAMISLAFEGDDGESFSLIDYSSAGKDWKSMIAAWLPYTAEND